MKSEVSFRKRTPTVVVPSCPLRTDKVESVCMFICGCVLNQERFSFDLRSTFRGCVTFWLFYGCRFVHPFRLCVNVIRMVLVLRNINPSFEVEGRRRSSNPQNMVYISRVENVKDTLPKLEFNGTNFLSSLSRNLLKRVRVTCFPENLVHSWGSMRSGVPSRVEDWRGISPKSDSEKFLEGHRDRRLFDHRPSDYSSDIPNLKKLRFSLSSVRDTEEGNDRGLYLRTLESNLSLPTWRGTDFPFPPWEIRRWDRTKVLF